MKTIIIKELLFLLLITCTASISAQDGKFSFTISSPVSTSAGVFKTDGTLVRTLWNNVKYSGGTYSKTWDGKDDQGVQIASPESNYQVKVLSNNVQYTWQGTIGNTSDSLTGNSKFRGYYHCMQGMAISGDYGYYCAGYPEGSPSIAKFLISTHNSKTTIFPNDKQIGVIDFVCADASNVYWSTYDAHKATNSFVFATKVSDDLPTDFQFGSMYSVTYGKTYTDVISKVDMVNGTITGLAVQKTGNNLFVARSGINQLQVLNKTTGELIKTLAFTSPHALSVDASGNLWMATGSNVVSKYVVNADGSLNAANVTLSGLIDPAATQVSPDGTSIAVADAGNSQQVKFFNTSNGVYVKTLGSANGYYADAAVNDNKFYFTDANGKGSGSGFKNTFITYQADGSFWIGDPGNFRVQHYNSNNNFVNRIMWLGASYNVYPDKNNIKRLFSDFLEFEVDYTVQALTGSTGWKLKRNWGANISDLAYEGCPKHVTTLSNGRTYGFLRNLGTSKWEAVEFGANGILRPTGVSFSGVTKIICTDGSYQDYVSSNGTGTVKRFPLTGFDGSGNPMWSSTPEILATGQIDNVIGSPVNTPNNQVFTATTDKIVFFNHKAYANNTGPVYSSGYHLGIMKRGANNSFMAKTEKSTHVNYQGEYPGAGWFDVGNLVNDYAGGNFNIVDRNIITSYHGEFWKNTQTNKYNHYYDNGLAIGQFGTTRPETSTQAAPMFAGNALTPSLVKDSAGNLYLYHGDEASHSAIHRWKITGLNTIAEQVITIQFPSSFAAPVISYENLMSGLPFNATLATNTAGWTRDAAQNAANKFASYYLVNTNILTYEKTAPPDVFIHFADKTAKTNSISRDLGINAVTRSWKITGEIAYPGSMPNGANTNQYLDVLDGNNKIIARFFAAINRSGSPVLATIYGNTKVIVQGSEKDIRSQMDKMVPFELSVVNDTITFTYANNPPVSTTIYDPTGNWKTPKTLRIQHISTAIAGPNYGSIIGLKDFKFYKDYTNPVVVNQAPVANAGIDQVITLPLNNVSLAGNAIDADGTITGYVWTQLSGPASGVILTPNAAATMITSLVQGVYKFRLTVTDNKGDIAKDTLQVTVNTGLNQPPVANAGSARSITLPVNSTTLTGMGTDVDGAIAGYLWVKIAGPSTGTIASPNSSVTALNNLAQGLYKFKLTVSDDDGAISTDSIAVTVNAAANLLPVANAGTDKVIILPTNSATLNGSGADNDGTISGYAWVKISGPATGTIASPTAASTSLSNLVQGVYQYQLSVTDNNGAVSKDTVTVTVNATINKAPVANAGTDKAITLPTNSTTLTGIGTDTDGIVTGYAWLKVSGPAAGTITSPSAATTPIGNLVQGSYQYQFSVTDNKGVVSKDTVKITVNGASNKAPVANAGADKIITLPTNSTTLSGSGTDSDGTISGYAWVKISGPAAGTIASPTAASTSLNNLVVGVYQYQLSVTDNRGAVSKATVKVTVNAAPNQAPVANAGADKIITLPTSSTTLSGSGTDSDGTISGYAWVKISGPATGTIASPTAASTSLNNLVVGVYQYQLSVTDNKGAVSKATVKVTVNAAPNHAPVANAGADKIITLPTSSTTLSGSGTDSDGTISGYAWVKISGPAAGTITSPTAASTSLNNLVLGVYQYQLSVTDNKGAVSKATVKVTVNTKSSRAKMASAGHDMDIVLPTNKVVLDGFGTDPVEKISSYKWSVIKGPAGHHIVNADLGKADIKNLFQGVYEVELKTTADDGYVSKDTVKITVSAPRLKNHLSNEIKIYPNPVKDLANISINTINQHTQLSITVVNVVGMQVKYSELVTSSNNTIHTINMSNLPDGYYFVTIRFDDGKKSTLKILKAAGK